MKYDGHIHTPFCPHGSNDSMESYVEAAIRQGFSGLTFTEHAPLPKNFQDPSPTNDSSMREEDVATYFDKVHSLKLKYQNKINIKTGFEVDYIIGYEEETKKLLNMYGPYIEDGILSVHFLRKAGKYYCMDYSAELFSEIVNDFGGLQEVYQAYFNIVKQSILADLGEYKPRRIGHITLVNKFQKKFAEIPNYKGKILSLLDLIQQKNYELDYNGAGVVKPDCGEPYPPGWVIKEAVNRNIPLVYGSDAHTAKGIGQGINQLVSSINLSKPL